MRTLSGVDSVLSTYFHLAAVLARSLLSVISMTINEINSDLETFTSLLEKCPGCDKVFGNDPHCHWDHKGLECCNECEMAEDESKSCGQCYTYFSACPESTQEAGTCINCVERFGHNNTVRAKEFSRRLEAAFAATCKCGAPSYNSPIHSIGCQFGEDSCLCGCND